MKFCSKIVMSFGHKRDSLQSCDNAPSFVHPHKIFCNLYPAGKLITSRSRCNSEEYTQFFKSAIRSIVTDSIFPWCVQVVGARNEKVANYEIFHYIYLKVASPNLYIIIYVPKKGNWQKCDFQDVGLGIVDI